MAVTRFRVTGAATDTAIIAAPGAGSALQINYVEFTVSAAATVSLSQGADGSTTRIFDGDLAANAGVVLEGSGDRGVYRPWATLPSNTAFNITNSAGNIKGVVFHETVSSV